MNKDLKGSVVKGDQQVHLVKPVHLENLEVQGAVVPLADLAVMVPLEKRENKENLVEEDSQDCQEVLANQETEVLQDQQASQEPQETQAVMDSQENVEEMAPLVKLARKAQEDPEAHLVSLGVRVSQA